MTRPLLRCGLAAATALLLAGCIVVPRTTEVYDPECRIRTRQMELEPVQLASIQHCANQDCVMLLAAAGVTAAASTVISGSIVIVGNVVYWFEKQGLCNRADTR